MAATKYTYSIQNDFPNHKVASDRLKKEIQDSAIVTALDRIATTGDDCDIWFKDALSSGDQATLDTIVANHSGEPLPQPNDPALDSQGAMLTVPVPELDREMKNIVTHNFCDKCTWWQQAATVTGETLTTSDNLTYSSAYPFWIDLTHGRFYLEDRVENRDTYIPVVKVDGVTKTEDAPFGGAAGDYSVDYRNGTVTFHESQTGVVTASYKRATSSLFTIAPTAGHYLLVKDSEVQFSVDVDMKDTVNFQAWAYNPSDLPNKMPVSNKTNYKTIRNFIEEARGCYPVIPAIGGSSRGLTNNHVVFPFNYLQAKKLTASLGVEIRVWLDNDVEFGGEFGTATFYCYSYDET